MDKGRVPTDSALRVIGHAGLWAAGDCALVPWNDRGVIKPAPPTAQLALRQGNRLGRNLARSLRGEEPRPFTYRYLGQLATIGRREAVAEVLGLRFSGFIAWFLWRTIYLAKLPGVMRKLRVMIDWTFELVFPRDLSLVLPLLVGVFFPALLFQLLQLVFEFLQPGPLFGVPILRHLASFLLDLGQLCARHFHRLDRADTTERGDLHYRRHHSLDHSPNLQ